MATIEESYGKLKGTYDLPDFSVLDNSFEIYDLEESRYILRKIRRHMVEKLKNHVEILEDLIHPNSTVSAYHEYKFLDDRSKKIIYDLYSKLMSLTRVSQRLDLESDDKKDAEYIKELLIQWQVLKKDLLELIIKLNKSWTEEEITDKSVSSYLG